MRCRLPRLTVVLCVLCVYLFLNIHGSRAQQNVSARICDPTREERQGIVDCEPRCELFTQMPPPVITCSGPNITDCFCKAGLPVPLLLDSDDRCVPLAQCGCSNVDGYHQINATWKSSDCSQSHTCVFGPPSNVSTVAIDGCNSTTEVCQMVNGDYACVCQTGYSIVGGQCTKDPLTACPVPDSIANGTVTTPIGRGYMGVAQYTCNTEFQMSGSAMRICQVDFAWGGTAPTCGPIECPHLYPIGNGTVNTSNGLGLLSTATYECDPGFVLSNGNEQRVCQANREWDGIEPTCAYVQCPPLDPIANGTVNTSNGLGLVSTASYACQDEFVLSNGTEQRVCQANSEWDGVEPTCVHVQCPPLDPIANGTVTTSNGRDFMSTATYECDPEFVLFNGGDPMVCQVNSEWDGMEPTCVHVQCPPLDPIANGTVNTSNGRDFMSTATYECDAKFLLLNETEQRVCQASSVWDGIEPTCVYVQCPPLDPIPNGSVNMSHGLGYHAKARYKCNDGFKLSGNRRRKCRSDSEWDNNEPTCEATVCGDLGVVKNGHVTTPDGRGYNAKAVYHCSEGARMFGKSRRTCQANTKWSGQAPVCAIFPSFMGGGYHGNHNGHHHDSDDHHDHGHHHDSHSRSQHDHGHHHDSHSHSQHDHGHHHDSHSHHHGHHHGSDSHASDSHRRHHHDSYSHAHGSRKHGRHHRVNYNMDDVPTLGDIRHHLPRHKY